MKKISLYMMMLLAVCFTACTEDFNEGVADPQSYPQEAAQALEGFAFALGSDATSPIVLDKETVDTKTLEMLKITTTPTLSQGAKAIARVIIATTANWADAIELPATTKDGTSTVTAIDLDEAVKTLFGKAPLARTCYIGGYIYILDGTSASLIAKNPVSVGTVNITPVSPVIETAYYITGELAGGWGSASVLKFTHSGKDVYEDPIFTLLVNNTVATANFKIIPQSGIGGNDDLFWGSALGTATDGDTSLTGTVVSANAGAIQVAGEGWFKIILDMMSYTYTIEKMNVSPYLWVPGNHQGWSPATAPKLYTPAMDLLYTGHAYMDGGFKFTGQADWNPVEYGYGSFASLSNNITDDGGNMSLASGFYFLRVNLNTSSFEATQAAWAMIGDATVGGWSTETPMTYNKVSNVWTVTTTLAAGSLKFRANNDWAINMGGTAEKLLFNKDNLTSPGTGNYTVTLHLGNDDNSYCSFTKNE